MSSTDATVTVFLNDVPAHLPAPATLQGLLAQAGLAGRPGIAAAVNGEVVPRDSWNLQELSSNDRVLLIRATQGG